MPAQSERERGVISIEATIVLTAFLFFMMFLYSLLIMVMAQSAMSTALLRSAQSLSLDSYAVENYYGETGLGPAIADFFGLHGSDSTTAFFSDQKWYASEQTLEAAVESRFYGYLAGGEAESRERLAAFHITDLSFDGSLVDAGGDLTLRLTYQLSPAFNFFGLTSISVEKTACSKMWGDVSATSITPVASSGG